MANPVGSHGLPQPPARAEGIIFWASTLIRVLTTYLTTVTHELGQQPKCPQFLTADIPAAADWKGRIIFVSDAAAGARFQGSTGSAWVNLG